MAVRFTVLASGSGGNASFLEAGDFGLLLDIGLGPRQLAKRLAAAGAGWSRVRAVLLTHTHSDHAPATARLVAATGAEVLAFAKRGEKDSDIVADRLVGDGDSIEGTEFGFWWEGGTLKARVDGAPAGRGETTFERDGDGWIAASGRERGERLRVDGDRLIWAGYEFTRKQQPFPGGGQTSAYTMTTQP